MDTRKQHMPAPGESPPAVVSPLTGYVSEMFCSVQGEGKHVGQRQLFVRMAGCSATCYWCDTVPSKVHCDTCRIHGAKTRTLPNPLAAAQVAAAALSLIEEDGAVRTVSLTGGEPLEQSEFTAEIASILKTHGLRIHLETSGIEVDGLKRIAAIVDVVAMDIKLPYAMGREHWEAHHEFLDLLVGHEVFVKIVIDDITPFDEIEAAVELIASVDERVPLVLQPESMTFLKMAKGPEGRNTLMALLLRAQRHAAGALEDVRIIPQCHRIFKIR